MSNINFNLNNGNEDFTSLKEAIFKRAREKAEALNTEIKTNYTSDIKNDIMESARQSIHNNPFLNLIEEEPIENIEITPKRAEIKHSRDYIELKPKKTLSKINNELYTAAIREGAMREASETIRQNKTIMNCLTFLNTQAAIANNKSFFKNSDNVAQEITFGI